LQTHQFTNLLKRQYLPLKFWWCSVGANNPLLTMGAKVKLTKPVELKFGLVQQ
jgi:hypothetical protein